MKSIKYIYLVLLSLLLVACSKKEPQVDKEVIHKDVSQAYDNPISENDDKMDKGLADPNLVVVGNDSVY